MDINQELEELLRQDYEENEAGRGPIGYIFAILGIVVGVYALAAYQLGFFGWLFS